MAAPAENSSPDIGYILTNFHPVYSKILSYLNSKDLNRARLVCNAWSKTGQVIDIQRNRQLFEIIIIKCERNFECETPTISKCLE